MGQGYTGGKHESLATPREPGYNTAGVPRDFKKNSAGTKREFIGSRVRHYTYARVINGVRYTVTISAHTVDEADRLARIRGFKTSDREIKRRKKKRKK